MKKTKQINIRYPGYSSIFKSIQDVCHTNLRAELAATKKQLQPEFKSGHIFNSIQFNIIAKQQHNKTNKNKYTHKVINMFAVQELEEDINKFILSLNFLKLVWR